MQILVLIGLYFLWCTKFDQLILRKIIKIVATRCQILTLKCTKSALPDPLAGFKGTTSNGRGREGREGKEGEERGGKVRVGEGTGGEGGKRREEGRGREGKGGEGAGKGEVLHHFSFYNLTTAYI